jgi:outer membrane protein assembly factor BamB
MKMLKKKIAAIAIAIFFVLSMVTVLSAVQPVNALTYKTYAYITVEPNPVGVGQTVTVLFFLSEPAPTATAGFVAATNWDNFTVKVTSPGGQTESFGPYTSDATGGAYFTYVPTAVGNYKFDFNFPGQTIKGYGIFGAPVGPDYYGPSSATTNLTVQQQPIASYPIPPLPTSYWTEPVYGENRGWNEISGNWLAMEYNSTTIFTGAFNPYTTAPTTAHIVWTKQQYLGGIVGGDIDSDYYQGPTYQSYWVPPIILNGRLYYMQRQVPGNGWVGLYCVDLYTGKELWFQPEAVIGSAGAGGGGVPNLFFAQVFTAYGVNGAGSEAFIWNCEGANWTVFDANSGTLVYTITNPPTGTTPLVGLGILSGPNWIIDGDSQGSVIAYYMDGLNNWLLKWNSTQLLVNSGISAVSNLYLPPLGESIPWSDGIMWNVTIPHGAGIQGFYLGAPTTDGNVVFSSTADIATPVNNFTLYAYSATDGHYLWSNNFANVFTPGSTLWNFFLTTNDGIITVYNKNTEEFYGYSEATGTQVWGPTHASGNAWDTYILEGPPCQVAAYGNLYVSTYAGKVYCIGLQNGTLLWTYTLPNSGYDTPYGDYPAGGGMTVADGMVYVCTGEHTPSEPLWLGGAMYCINASTGDLVYDMSGWWTNSPAIADGHALDENCYDGTIYCFGMGQTATTVTAPDSGVTLGQTITITGTVMDASPGPMDYAGNLLWKADSTPAIADQYMTQWMEYLYQQKPMPTNATGVPVTLSVVDVNGNHRVIGTTTSDDTGFYSFHWTPDISSNYTLTATFAGSNSYYGSSAETAFYVMPALPTASPYPTPATGLASTGSLMLGVAVIVIVIIIIGAVIIMLMLRKRP